MKRTSSRQITAFYAPILLRPLKGAVLISPSTARRAQARQ